MHVAVLILLSLLLYGSKLRYHYVSDDLMVYASSGKKPKKFLSLLFKQFMGLGYWDCMKRQGRRRKVKIKLSRFWVRLLLNVFPRQREEINALAHAMSIFLHTLCSVLVYVAFSQYGNNTVAWVGALYFLVSPVNHEGSLWLSGKHYVMTACLLLIMFIEPILSIALIWLVPYITVTAMPFPLVFIPTIYWPFALIIPFMFKNKKPYLNKGKLYEEATEPMQFTPKKVILAVKFYGYNVFNGITALHCTQFQSYLAGVFTNSRGQKQGYKLDKFFFIGILTAVATVYGVIRQEPWGLGLFWFSVLIAPFCNLFSIGQQLVTSRYNYLAHAGLYFALAYILMPYPYLVGGVLFWYISKLLVVKQSYKNDYWNTAYATFDEPTYVQSWIHYGTMHYSRFEFHAAVLAFIEGKEHDPDNFHCWFNLSSCFLCLNRLPDAIATLERAKKCELLFQNYTRQNVIREREALIGKIYEEQKAGRSFELKLKDVCVLV